VASKLWKHGGSVAAAGCGFDVSRVEYSAPNRTLAGIESTGKSFGSGPATAEPLPEAGQHRDIRPSGFNSTALDSASRRRQ
jgi:hypothetical protein